MAVYHGIVHGNVNRISEGHYARVGGQLSSDSMLPI